MVPKMQARHKSLECFDVFVLCPALRKVWFIMKRKERTKHAVRFPLCGFVRPSPEKNPTVANDFDAYGKVEFYMCKIDCLACDKRLGALESRKRYEETRSHDGRWQDAIVQNFDFDQFVASTAAVMRDEW